MLLHLIYYIRRLVYLRQNQNTNSIIPNQNRSNVINPPLLDSYITPKKGGRKKIINDEIIQKLTRINNDSNLLGDSLSSREIVKLIEKERHLELGPGANLDALRPVSRSVGMRAVKKIAPVYILHPDIQNKRRLEAKSDIFNQISLAAVATAILAPNVTSDQLLDPEFKIESEYTLNNIHCIDAMSVLLFDRLNEGVRIGNNIRAELKRKSRSISKTINQPQSRTVKCYFDANASHMANTRKEPYG